MLPPKVDENVHTIALHTSPNASRSRLCDLPNELLDHIFAYLETAPPSKTKFHDLPSLTWLESDKRTLKSVSCLSHRLRVIVLSRLFAYVRVDPDSVTELLLFLHRNSLPATVKSIVFQIPSVYSNHQSSSWCRLLDGFPRSRIVIQCEPQKYDWVSNLRIKLTDAWAFRMPCQYTEFMQDPQLARNAGPCDPEVGIFAARQWQHLAVNEGSSLAAYTTYEYFLKQPPSLIASSAHAINLAASHQQSFGDSMVPLIAASSMIANLRSFTYIAVFPFYNHIGDILKCVEKMTNLRKMSMTFSPQPGSTVLEDEMNVAKGSIDINDPWTELDISYSLIADQVRLMGIHAHLESFTAGDLHNVRIRSGLVTNISQYLTAIWEFDGIDTWNRQPVHAPVSTESDESTEAVQNGDWIWLAT